MSTCFVRYDNINDYHNIGKLQCTEMYCIFCAKTTLSFYYYVLVDNVFNNL